MRCTPAINRKDVNIMKLKPIDRPCTLKVLAYDRIKELLTKTPVS